MYRRIPRNEIAEVIAHLNELHRQTWPSSDQEFRAWDRREATTRTLLSNVRRTKEHPTLSTLLEVADAFSLTIEGAHRLFGYDLNSIREHDTLLNGARTHIVESYGFERDLLIDLPHELASEEVFSFNRTLRDLVLSWQKDITFRTLESPKWRRPGAFYVHVGTEDSLGSSLPPGSLALVEPVEKREELQPNPRFIYLLQFSNGYRCSRCVVTHGRLHLLSTERMYRAPQAFVYPGSVRIAGRIRSFALGLPSPEYPELQPLPIRAKGADLVLPWEHRTRDRLFSAGHNRFVRSKADERHVRELLETQLYAKLSPRTERRYRYPSPSQPHVNVLIALALTNFARYSDALATSGAVLTDTDRFSLESLLNVRRLSDIARIRRIAATPRPSEVWEKRRSEFIEWPPLLSLKFPQLQLWENKALRLAETTPIGGLTPDIAAGSWMLLEDLPVIPDTGCDRDKSGWSRPIYVLQRGIEFICGHLDREDDRYTLVSERRDQTVRTSFRLGELPSLRRVAGIAVPV